MEKKTKISIALIATVIGVILGFLIYKIFIFIYYDGSKFNENTKNYTIKDTWTITHKELKENEYLEENGLKVKNNFKEFTKEESKVEGLSRYNLYSQNEERKKLIASIWFYKQDTTLFEGLKNNVSYMNIVHAKEDDFAKLIERNNIKDEIELIKYAEKLKEKKVNLLTDVNTLKEGYLFGLLNDTVLLSKDYIIIDGDYKGYLYTSTSNNKIKSLTIINDNKSYDITFVQTDFFTDDYIKEFIETLVVID